MDLPLIKSNWSNEFDPTLLLTDGVRFIQAKKRGRMAPFQLQIPKGII